MIDYYNWDVMYRREKEVYVAFVYDDNNCIRLWIPVDLCKEKNIVDYIKENFSNIFSLGEF